jgi:hypothetical protein
LAVAPIKDFVHFFCNVLIAEMGIVRNDGFEFVVELERHGDIAIFAQTHKVGQVTRYEVVRIRIQPAHTWPDGHVTPEREAYPGASAWGRDAFTCHTLAEALALARQLQGLAVAGREPSAP